MFWVEAETETGLTSGFCGIAGLLQMREKDEKDTAIIVAAVKRWLESNDGWLLILDNADRPDVLEPFLPRNPKGCFLVTSRASNFDRLGIAAPLEMETMPPDKALEFLFARTGRERSQVEEDTAGQLAKELGYLPLALEQAGAYIKAKQSTFVDYLKAYRTRHLNLLDASPPAIGKYPKSVCTTWSMNFAEVEKTSKASADLLRVSAFLSPDNIPLELIVEGASHLGGPISKALEDLESNPVALDELLEPLTRYCLIRRDLNSNTYSIHRLVQEVVKGGMDERTQRKWAECTVRAVNQAFPSSEFENWAKCDRFLPQALSTAGLIENSKFEFEEAGRLLNQVAYYLDDRASYVEAESLYKRALGIHEKAYGPEHPDVATCLKNYAILLREMNRPEKAAEFEARVADIRARRAEKNPTTPPGPDD